MIFKYGQVWCETLLDMQLMMGMLDTRESKDGHYSVVHDLLLNQWGFRFVPGIEPISELLRKWNRWCEIFGRPENDMVGDALTEMADEERKNDPFEPRDYSGHSEAPEDE